MTESPPIPGQDLRESLVSTEAAKQTRELDKRLNPTRIFVDKNRLALCWFIIAALAIAAAVFQPIYLVRQLKKQERVVIIDPAGTYYVSPILEFQTAKDLHAEQSTLATISFLERGPEGFDHPQLLQRIFLKPAHEKALKHRSFEKDEFKAKQLHQKAEIAEIKILETRESYVLTEVRGQLIRTGIFEGKAFSEAVPFRLAFKMKRNPDMTQNGRFPTAVADFKYETTSQQ
jgi:hypothetical protein